MTYGSIILAIIGAAILYWVHTQTAGYHDEGNLGYLPEFGLGCLCLVVAFFLGIGAIISGIARMFGHY